MDNKENTTMKEDRTLEALKDVIRTFWETDTAHGRDQYDIATDIVETAGIEPDELRELGFEEIADTYHDAYEGGGDDDDVMDFFD